ncbi:MAG: RES family NAD+ phosphorylase [Dinghuibacter sp.]|nr:RES family NAD+ phosphorylase [Dinghuibacter sp.]
MVVYRITLAEYARSLFASGNEARWNSRGAKVMYTAESRSLACLENLVHRGGIGLNGLFRTMVIEIPDSLPVTVFSSDDLPDGWAAPFATAITRGLGDNWYRLQQTPVLKVCSAIIPAENNFIINTLHPSFKKIKLLRTEPFMFDTRLGMK